MKNIELYNFRCFRHLAIEFSKGINLLIGDNASGKTSLLWACKYAINSFFSGFSDVYTRWSSPVRDDFRRVVAGEKGCRLNLYALISHFLKMCLRIMTAMFLARFLCL